MTLNVLRVSECLMASRVFPILFTVIISYFVLLSLLGYQSVAYISVLTIFPLAFLLFRRVSVFLVLYISVIFLVIFDNDVLNWTDSKIRPWYFSVMVILLIAQVRGLIGNKSLAIKNPMHLIVLAYYLLMSAGFFLLEDSVSRLYIAKYWLFSIGLVYALLYSAKQSKISLGESLQFWQFTILFSAIWGLLQFSGNILGFSRDLLQHDWYNISPSGFLSERTWYGQYSAVGLILSVYYFVRNRNISQFLMILLCSFCVIISFSRSATIPLMAGLLCYFFYCVVHRAFSRSLVKFIVGFCLLLLMFVFLDFGLEFNLKALYSKFDISDIGVQGRFEALELFFVEVQRNPYGYILGNGFSWDEGQVSSIGTAVGAKSSNLFLMIFHVFGVLGLSLGLVAFLAFFYKYMRLVMASKSTESLLGFILLSSFIGLSLVVPAHQFPSSLVIFFFSIFIYKQLRYA